jgi:hypothetical protein
MESETDLAFSFQKSLDLFAQHGDDFWKHAFQNGPSLNETMRPRFTFRVSFPVK